MEENYVVTSRVNPDLDGVACMYAYKEFIEKCGRKAEYYISGTLKKEIDTFCKMFGIEINPKEKIEENDNIVLIGTNSELCVEDIINIENVTEVIDNQVEAEGLEKFINANITVEPVKAVATLVGQRFMEYGMDISDNSAILLYCGIASSTLKHISQKDKKVLKWLKSKCKKIDDAKMQEIFEGA